MKHMNMRRSVKWICTLIACTLLAGLIPLGVFAAESVAFENLALGKEVTASSSFNDFYIPDKMVDGTKRRGGPFDYSRWNSQATKGEEWLVLDLGSVVPVGSVRIEWWDWQNLAGTITVLTSVDGAEYTQVGKVEGNFQVAFNHFAFDEAVEAQYIKIILNDCIGDWGYSILELEVYPNGDNLAMGKTITASSTHELGYTTDRMIDGVKTEEYSRWNSVATTGEEWLIVDLEKIEAVQTVYMEWWDWVNIAGTVTVLTSVDGVEYKEIGKVEGNKEVGFNLFNLSEPVEARYIKIVFHNCVSEWGYSLAELEIYAAKAPVEEEDRVTNLALGKTVTASSSFNDFYTPDKVVDGDKIGDAGRWNSQATKEEEWVLIDLEEVKSIEKVHMEWWDWQNLARTVKVLVSTDNESYKQIGIVEGNFQVAFNTFEFTDPVSARYIKIVLDDCIGDWGYSLKEIEVIGSDLPAEEDCKHTGGKATCTDQAVCTECGDSYSEVDADNHGETELKGAKEATETEPGYTGDTVCKDCGKIVESGKEIPATGTEVTPPPTGDTLTIALMLSAVAVFAMAMVGFRQRGKHSSH